jgi:broad specificity phosphatase PhoE
MAFRLIVLRHGETDWNQESRYQGCVDTRLSAEGRTQAAAVARALSDRSLAAIYSSPLARALETAEAIARPHGLRVRAVPAFNEICHGAWEGLTVAEVRAAFPDLYARWREVPEAVTMPDGESLAQVEARAAGELLRLRSVHEGETVCLVSHDVPVRLLILGALGLPPDRLWAIYLSATGLSEIEYGRDWTTLHRMNSVSHLGDLVASLAHGAH